MDGKENIPRKWGSNLLILHLSILLPKKDTRFGTNGDSLIHSVLRTFTKCISCFVKEGTHLSSWSFQFRHRIDKKACNNCDSCPQICVRHWDDMVEGGECLIALRGGKEHRHSPIGLGKVRSVRRGYKDSLELRS